MLGVWNSVKVKNPDHARDGTAGVVHAVNPAELDKVAVRFDLDLVIELVPVADLERLA